MRDKSMRRVGMNLVILSVIVVLTLNFGALPPFGVDLVLAQDSRSGGEIRSIAWHPDGTLIAVGQGYDICNFEHYEDYSIRLLDALTGDLINELDANYCTVRFLDWNSDGTKLISTGGADADGYGIVWDINSGEKLALSPPVSMPGRLMDRWSPDDSRVLSVSEAYRAVDIWDPITGDIQLSIPTGPVDAAAWDPTGQKIVAGRAPTIWNAVMGEEILTLSTPEERFRPTSIIWSAENSRIIAGRPDGLIDIWDGGTHAYIHTLVGHTRLISSIALSPDNSRLASASHDGTIRIWNAATGALLETIAYPGPVYALDWSPDGTKLAYGGADLSGGMPEVKIVDVADIGLTPEATQEAVQTP